MTRVLKLCLVLLVALPVMAEKMPFGKGTLSVRRVARNAVRIQYYEQEPSSALPDWLYVSSREVKHCDVKVAVDAARQTGSLSNRRFKITFP